MVPVRPPRKGILGLYEATLRRFQTAMHALSLLPLYAVGSLCIGLSLVPGVLLFNWVAGKIEMDSLFRIPVLCTTAAAGYFLYGTTLILLLPALNFALRMRPRPFRGPYHSLATARWYIHNGLTYIARYTFLEFITPTPFNNLFYRLMGMKMGKGAQINTSHISDPGMIELGDNVTIGGSATIVAHYGVGGFLIIAPVKIGSGATIGLRATIMGGVEIGERARILPNSVVLPNVKVPAGETWGGVPAARIETKRDRERGSGDQSAA
ncbi:MAG: hypothetical protein NDJ89_17145 [Oligoflexia bacterium]|nr:hypothetical protein [Oligoflexia bacterium]